MKTKTELIVSIGILAFFLTVFAPLAAMGFKQSAVLFVAGCLALPAASAMLVVRNFVVVAKELKVK